MNHLLRDGCQASLMLAAIWTESSYLKDTQSKTTLPTGVSSLATFNKVVARLAATPLFSYLHVHRYCSTSSQLLLMTDECATFSTTFSSACNATAGSADGSVAEQATRETIKQGTCDIHVTARAHCISAWLIGLL